MFLRGNYSETEVGFPCPGYTKMNRFQQAEDIKNSLVVVFLSYVDFYRPKYVLMENVKDLLSHRVSSIIICYKSRN